MACNGPPLFSSLLPEYGCEYEICEDLSNVQDGKTCKTCKAMYVCTYTYACMQSSKV